MKMMSELPRCTSVVELLDWFEKPDHIIMVLEWPSPFMDLIEFAELHNGHLSEAQTRDIMLQVVQASRHCATRD